jgi:hypothetical protein
MVLFQISQPSRWPTQEAEYSGPVLTSPAMHAWVQEEECAGQYGKSMYRIIVYSNLKSAGISLASWHMALWLSVPDATTPHPTTPCTDVSLWVFPHAEVPAALTVLSLGHGPYPA